MTAPILLPERLQPADATIAQAVGNEVVLLNLESGIYFSLNDMGALVWRSLEAREPLATIEEHIIEEYDVLPTQAHDDLRTFLHSLLEKALVVSA